MTTQIHSYGKSVSMLLKAGQQTTKCDIPLGTYFDDGLRKYHWAYIAAKAAMGHVFVRNTSAFSKLSGGDNAFKSAVAGFGNAVGDRIIKVWGASGSLAAGNVSKFEDGFFEVISGIGAGHSYQIAWCETGGTGTTKVYLKEELAVKLSTNTTVNLRPNPYYGMEQGAANKWITASLIPGGVPTVSAATSGFQLVQVRGPGIAEGGAAVGYGKYIGMGASGTVVSALVLSGKVLGSGTLKIVGISRAACAADGDHFSVDWMIESF